jgi:hypothetical protein
MCGPKKTSRSPATQQPSVRPASVKSTRSVRAHVPAHVRPPSAPVRHRSVRLRPQERPMSMYTSKHAPGPSAPRPVSALGVTPPYVRRVGEKIRKEPAADSTILGEFSSLKILIKQHIENFYADDHSQLQLIRHRITKHILDNVVFGERQNRSRSLYLPLS